MLHTLSAPADSMLLTLEPGIVGVDVLEFDRRRSLAGIHCKIAKFNAQIVVGGRLWKPSVKRDPGLSPSWPSTRGA